MGGAIGNFIDRFLTVVNCNGYNGVVDFIDIGVYNYRWYTFNVADLAITIGLFIYLYQTYIMKTSDWLYRINIDYWNSL